MGKHGYTSNMNANEKLMVAIVRVSESYKKDCSAIFGKCGLTFAQYTVLRALEGSEGGRNTITNVSRIMLVSGANMTGISKRLEKSGFLLRKSDPGDERVTILEITMKGKSTIQEIEAAKEALIRTYLHGYSSELKKLVLEHLKGTMRRSQDAHKPHQ